MPLLKKASPKKDKKFEMNCNGLGGERKKKNAFVMDASISLIILGEKPILEKRMDKRKQNEFCS